MMENVTYREIRENELNRGLFAGFVRRQVVVKCLRRENNAWVVKDDPFVDDWSDENYEFLVSCLKNTIATGGLVYGAFAEGLLKGFCSVEAQPFGRENQYLDLTSIHVSADFRGQGIGRVLFAQAKAWAKGKGAKKLYISAHSAVETQAFYRAMGCVDAEEYNERHVQAEPFDCQMECKL